MSPLSASVALWLAWVLSWIAAALWSRPTRAAAPFASQVGYRLFTGIGGVLLMVAADARLGGRAGPVGWFLPAWRLPLAASWAATALVAAGFAFCWWARLTLGDLWSSSVTRKEAHQVVRRGPYALVRHPIYTGLIASALALSIQTGAPVALLGVALMTLGFWMKARLEERFLGDLLGPDYDAYRRTTPMLAPFWPPRR